MDLEAQLRRIETFHHMNADSLHRVAAAMQLVRMAPGEVIMAEGQSGKFGDVGLLLSGELRVEQADGTSLGRILPGEFFGEMAVVDELPRSATVTAAEVSEAATIKSWQLRTLIAANPDVAMSLLSGLSRRLREARA